MHRVLSQRLLAWKDHPTRTPLILRGARQVGKSYLVNQLGCHFSHFITLNFERDPRAKQLFQGSLGANALLSKISAYTEKPILPKETLLFLDEIQECEEALLALRYFKEETPELHVIAAGSLLDFALDKIGIPVGRVQFLYLHPLSFGEYLEATDKTILHDYLLHQDTIEIPLHEKLLEELRYYCWLGGMPAVVDAWRTHQNPQYCQDIQDQLIQSYRQDFSKYAKQHQIPYVSHIFDRAGLQIGQKFKYSKVDPDLRSAPLKEALSLLTKAGVIHVAYHSAGQGLPLSAGIDLQKFKAFFFDIGLLQRMQALSLKEWLLAPLSVTYMGGIAEQLVAQEYIAYTATQIPAELFYWQREVSHSHAEIDFLFQCDHHIIPVEVKSGSQGRLKSLASFLQSHPHSTSGLVISEKPAWQQGQLQGISLYALERFLLKSFASPC